MRDVATLVWVVLLVIGVISSMVASARRRMNALPPRGAPIPPPAAPAAQVPQPQAPLRQQLVQQMKHVAGRLPAPAGAATGAPAAPAPPAVAGRAPARRRLFPGRQGLAGAVIAAEVLGKPRALRDEYFGS
jgi:hypothetical protein